MMTDRTILKYYDSTRACEIHAVGGGGVLVLVPAMEERDSIVKDGELYYSGKVTIVPTGEPVIEVNTTSGIRSAKVLLQKLQFAIEYAEELKKNYPKEEGGVR